MVNVEARNACHIFSVYMSPNPDPLVLGTGGLTQKVIKSDVHRRPLQVVFDWFYVKTSEVIWARE